MSRSQEIAPQVAKFRAAGMNWHQIGRSLGVTSETARRSIDPEYAALRAAKNNARRRVVRSYAPGKTMRVEPGRMSPEEAKRALATIPADTRGMTARLAGDPLPGRSALDQRGIQP